MLNPLVTKKAGRMFGKPAYAAAILVMVLAACGDASDRNANVANETGQTIARVNGQEITVHELEAELRLRAPIKPAEREAAARDALRRLVQRTLLAQKAVSVKLDRTPEVMMELRRKRIEILAQAYLSDTLARQMPVTKVEVDDFVEQHPHYFSERKYYVFDQLLVENRLVTDEVMNAIKDLVTLEQVEQVLKQMEVPFSRRLNSNVGNQFSRKMATTLDGLASDEIFFVRTRDFAIISRIVGTRAQPVSGQNARDVAMRLLASKRNAKASRKVIQDLLAGAKIDFFGEFSKMHVLDAVSAESGAPFPGSPIEAKDDLEQDDRMADDTAENSGQ